jgi:putative peptide zinc metalloprotease protein
MTEQALPSNTLPVLKDGISITPFRDGAAGGERYLVEVGEVCFVASKNMRDVLTALGERPETLEELAEIYERRTGQAAPLEVLDEVVKSNIPDSLFSHTPPPKNQSPFILSFRMVPERFVGRVSSKLTWLYAKPVVITTLLAFVVCEYLMLSRSLHAIHQRFHGWDIPLFYLSLVAIALFHELGHAAACRRYQCPHGDIGFALYFIYPAFYTDVTKAWRLPPLRRAVIDVGGLYFQCFLIIWLTVYILLTQSLFASRLIWVTHFTMIFTLNPIFKMDGYWLLTDLSGLSNLHKQVGETLRRVARKIFRRPGADSAQVNGTRLKVLYLYTGLVLIYVAFIFNFLYRAVGNVIRYYPREVAPVLSFLRRSYETGSTRHVFPALVALIYMSIWPLLLCAILFFMVCRILRFAGGGQPLEVKVPEFVDHLIPGRWKRTRDA